MEKIYLLDASEVELEDYKNLRLESLREEPQAFGSSYKDQKDLPNEDWQTWLDRYKEGKRNWMIFASNSQKLIGMMGAYQTDLDFENKEANIIAVYVTKQSRGKGVSKILMKGLLDKLTNKTSIQKIKLSVNIDQIAAIKLYESFGFKVVEKDTVVLGDGKAHDEYLMQKNIK